jgi:pantetheine-phosphate adenylyltransferase
MHTIIYPGTFDPITLGHLGLIERAAAMFGKVLIAVANSEKKKPLFTLDERIDLCRRATAHLPNIDIKPYSNLLVDFARANNAHMVLRGVRAIADFEYELQQANMNRAMFPAFETVFLTPVERYAFISSTLVREIAGMGGNADQFVPPVVAEALHQRFPKG